MTSSALLFILIILGVAAGAVAVWLQLRESTRREIMSRASGIPAPTDVRRAVRRGLSSEQENSLKNRMLKKAPSIWAQNQSAQHRLVQAGHDGPVAPFAYSFVRLVSVVALPILAFLFIPQASFMKAIVAIGAALFVGLMLPPNVRGNG